MSAPKRPSDDQDPDYVSPGPTNAKQRKIYEESARANTANKITAIVEREFAKEIDDKEKEVLEIQNRLHKALKTLHLLRYVVVTDFYNRKQCQAPQAAESKQTQIHPAIKRLIGKTPRLQRVGLEDPGPSTSKHLEGILHAETIETRIKTEPFEVENRLGKNSGFDSYSNCEVKSEEKITVESENKNRTEHSPPKKIPRYIPPKCNQPNVTSPSRGVRHKVRKRIVVGNISKWIPPDWREDGASHKWMMYVRGSKDAPDITDFVSKVRFFLHPSYQPNDVVQVVSAPFHLSRRGWGEFPLRVQLHFKNVLNKPMDIIHYLKLDRTYTGLQTLGSETVVDIWIHTTPHNLKRNLGTDLETASVKTNEKVDSKKEETDLSIIKKEGQVFESLVNAPIAFGSSIKEEPIDTSHQLLSENCIKIEHNYVSVPCKEDHTEMVHVVENNMTIKHSPTASSEECTNVNSAGPKDSPVGESELSQKKNNAIVNLLGNDENCSSSGIGSNNILSAELTATPNKDVEKEVSSNGQCQLETSNCESPDIRQVNDSENISENRSKSGDAVQTVMSEVDDMNPKPIRKNIQNGEVAPVPLKLVKCNDKFFFMADIGNSSSNKMGFVKIANSDLMKNILAKKIQPTKVSMVGNADTGFKKIISVKSTALNNSEAMKLPNGQNTLSANTIVKDNTIFALTNTQSKSPLNSSGVPKNDETSAVEREHDKSKANFKLGCTNNSILKNNSQQLEMHKLATSLRSMPSKSEPLKITIPAPFEPTTRKKQILVLKNNKLISVNAANSSSLTAVLNSRQLNPRSLLCNRNQESQSNSLSQDTKADILATKHQVSLITKGMRPIEGGMSLLKPSISLLKKPMTNKLVPCQSKPPTILKINTSNSLLLNSNSVIPALQIATPLQHAQMENRNMIIHNRVGQTKLKKLPKGVKIDEIEDTKPMKVSVTLGKDKQKILSKRDTYEDILRLIETVEIKDTVGTLRYIIGRIPLITQEAKDSDYKQMHPYACCTQKEFFNFHIGKQRAHEWYRAKMVRSLLRKKGFAEDRLWSVKEILIWARIHGYTPVQSSLAIGNTSKTSKKLPDSNSGPISTCTESLQFNEWLENCKDSNQTNEESDIEIDVVHIADPKIKSEIKLEVTEIPKDTISLELDPSLQMPCGFVNETAREVGVRFQKEEIVPGVRHATAERLILQAMQCLVDDLMRRSLAKAWERNSNKCPDTIILDDVRGALLSREEFDMFTNEGLGSLQNMG